MQSYNYYFSESKNNEKQHHYLLLLLNQKNPDSVDAIGQESGFFLLKQVKNKEQAKITIHNNKRGEKFREMKSASTT